MKPSSLICNTVLIAAITAAAAGFGATASADAGKEKCYGVAKAGKNDCKGLSNSCAGQATRDGEGFLAVPKGLCEKLVGGSLAERQP